jgi:heterodisulfide reductase subunit A
MRPYGLREDLYREARSRGISLRYDFDKGISVSKEQNDLEVTFIEFLLRRRIKLQTDLLVLASAIVTEKENPLTKFYKLSQNEDGFFAEAHVKLRPVDFATDGVFMCGLAHSNPWMNP